ncbi:hypothetical protein JL858_18845, partial [Acinetobacter baumannii]|nr:hypothetical protein [Acinetobacter baumannii]
GPDVRHADGPPPEGARPHGARLEGEHRQALMDGAELFIGTLIGAGWAVAFTLIFERVF